MPEASFHFVTKVHYKAPLPGDRPQWGEHEVDYILLCQRPRAEIEATLRLNPNEVADVRWLTQEECTEFVDGAPDPIEPSKPLWAGEHVRHEQKISPWFGAIARELLHPWWTQLRAHRRVASVEPDGRIHRLAGAHEAMEFAIRAAATPWAAERASRPLPSARAKYM